MCYSKWIFLISLNIYLASDLSKFQNYFFLIILKDRSIPNTYELVVSNCWGMTRGRKYLIRMCHIIMSAFLSYWKCLWNVEIVFLTASPNILPLPHHGGLQEIPEARSERLLYHTFWLNSTLVVTRLTIVVRPAALAEIITLHYPVL